MDRIRQVDPDIGPSRSAVLPYLALGCVLAVVSWFLMRWYPAAPLERLVFPSASSTLAPSEARWSVTFLFHTGECPGLMRLVDRLNLLPDLGVEVRGLLVVDSAAFPQWRELVVANGIRFPVRPVSPARAARVLRPMGYERSPVVAVFDENRKLRMATDLAGEQSLGPLLEAIGLRSARDLHQRRGASR